MKRCFAVLLTLIMLLSLTGCFGQPGFGGGSSFAQSRESHTWEQQDAKHQPGETSQPEASRPEVPSEPDIQPAACAEDSWAVYWYLCGSDLETYEGFATNDLFEMMEVTLPDNVQVVIQTGGAIQWQNDTVDAGTLQRYLYSGDTLTLVDEQPSASMGDPATLSSFLRFAKTNYPAQRTAVVFWNHGGGSMSGVAFDELYGYDSLTLDEMRAAFYAVWGKNAQEPPVELVGFDACLMATVDVVAAFSDLAKYLVASQETEPGNGWFYSQLLSELAADPAMDGAELGRIICDAYYAGCAILGTHCNTTLSLTDLTQSELLLSAYERFGAESLAAACEDPTFFSEFARAALSSENYGGNTREEGYTNMVDLGHLARLTADTLPSAQSVLDSLEACVLYRVNGLFRSESTGLSCFYSYDGDRDSLLQYADQGTGSAFKHFFTYSLTGRLDEAGMTYVHDMDFSEPQELETLDAADWDNIKPIVDDDGYAILNLGPEAQDLLAYIGFSLFYVDGNTMVYLGNDNDLNADWENGVFADNFRGVWGSLDGKLVFMGLTFSGIDYNLYSVPILLNGQETNLQVAYDFTTEEWYILGARQGVSDYGMADKELTQLQNGDQITILCYQTFFEGDDDFLPFETETVTYSENTVFCESPLPDGDYIMIFEMRDAAGSVVYSDGVGFECRDGDIYTFAIS